MLKVNLLHPHDSFKMNTTFTQCKNDLFYDLGLQFILEKMTDDHKEMEICKQLLLSPCSDNSTIYYRQSITKDFIDHRNILQQFNSIILQSQQLQRKGFWLLNSQSTQSKITSAISLLSTLSESLKQLYDVANQYYSLVKSEGLKRLFKMFREEFNDEYISDIEQLLEELKFKDGMLVSAQLGFDGSCINYELHKKPDKIFNIEKHLAPSINLSSNDQAGGQDFSNRRMKAMAKCGQILVDSAYNVREFFDILSTELIFYNSALRLIDHIDNTDKWCFPTVSHSNREIRHLYDLALDFSSDATIVSNDLVTEASNLIVITGANQGGKTTFLRSLGQAQILFQAGLITPANVFESPIFSDIFTHFKREEDSNLHSGKLDEELERMSEIVSRIKKNSLLLCNESFASTNEIEGSEICFQISKGLLEYGTTIFSVTHLMDFALKCKSFKTTTYLRAEKLDNGKRNFKIHCGFPLLTSNGIDIYNDIFSL